MASPASANKAIVPPAREAPSEQRPFSDVTLRAEADGATSDVHRGVLGLHSRVFLDALTTVTLSTPPAVLPLPGKTADDLKLLTSFMYPCRSRDEGFSADSIARVCELGREYDMPELLKAADDWLASRAAQFALPPIPGFPATLSPDHKQHAASFLEMLQLAHEFKFQRFFDQAIASWEQITAKTAVLKECADSTRRLDNVVLLRLLTSACENFDKSRPGSNGHSYCSYCGRYR